MTNVLACMRGLVAAVTFSCFTPAAMAADWAGPYLGGSVGFTSDATKITIPDVPITFDADEKTASFGAIAGYNWDIRNFVWGLELDADLESVKRLVNIEGATDGGDVRNLFRFKTRLGFELLSDTLLYVQGGIVAADYVGTSGWLDTVLEQEELVAGWTLGAGLEYRLSPALSIRADAMWDKLGTVTLEGNDIVFERDQDLSLFSTRAGVLFHF